MSKPTVTQNAANKWKKLVRQEICEASTNFNFKSPRTLVGWHSKLMGHL